MSLITFFKSHVKGHFRNGKWVKDYDTSVVAKQKPLLPDLFSGHGHSWLNSKPKPPPPPPEGYHPKPGEKGEKIGIQRLSTATPVEAFSDPRAIATVLPGGDLPASLHGVPFEPWDDAPQTIEGWASVEGQNAMDERPLEAPKGMKVGAGVIVIEPDGRVWVVHPTNRFGGYKGTFPKGTQEEGLSLQASAIKEAYEESGLKVEIQHHLMDVKRTTSVARYYVAKRVGGSPSDAGWESQAVSLVPVRDLYTALNMTPDHKLAEMLGAGPPPKPSYSTPKSGTLPFG